MLPDVPPPLVDAPPAGAGVPVPPVDDPVVAPPPVLVPVAPPELVEPSLPGPAVPEVSLPVVPAPVPAAEPLPLVSRPVVMPEVSLAVVVLSLPRPLQATPATATSNKSADPVAIDSEVSASSRFSVAQPVSNTATDLRVLQRSRQHRCVH
jgi:hypothetical protein